MKKINYKIRLFLCSLIICLAFSVPAWSLSLGDIGGIDVLLDWTYLENSSDAGEAAWITDFLGKDVTITKLEEFDDGRDDPDPWTQAQLTQDELDEEGDVDVWFYDFDGKIEPYPDYYLVKLGNIFPSLKTDSPVFDTFLYLNDNRYAAIDLIDIVRIAAAETTVDGVKIDAADYVIDIFKVSHISITDGTPVPEPATMALFGLGLLGLAGIGRKTKK